MCKLFSLYFLTQKSNSSSNKFQEPHSLLFHAQEANQGKINCLQTAPLLLDCPNSPLLPFCVAERSSLSVSGRALLLTSHSLPSRNFPSQRWRIRSCNAIKHCNIKIWTKVYKVCLKKRGILGWGFFLCWGFFVCFQVFLTSGKASKENSKEAASKLAAPQAKQPNLRVHCSLPATSDYLLQSNKSFPP